MVRGIYHESTKVRKHENLRVEDLQWRRDRHPDPCIFRAFALSCLRDSKWSALWVRPVGDAEEATADAVDEALGDEAAGAVEDIVHLVVVGIGVAIHPERFGASLPDGNRDVVKREGLTDGPGHAQQGHPVATGPETMQCLPPRGLRVAAGAEFFAGGAVFQVVPQRTLLGHDALPRRGKAGVRSMQLQSFLGE